MAKAAKKKVTMPVMVHRRSPLDGVIRQGRHGNSGSGTPGVRLELRHPLSILTIIARKGKTRALNEAMKKHFGTTCPEPGESADGRGVVLHWAGPDQWFAIADNRSEGELYTEMRWLLEGLASVSDQSHGRVVISVSGSRARELIAKGTPVDLHPSEFGVGRTALTQMAHVGVHIAQTGEDTFELSVFRGFVESFWEWLTEMSLEFGYEVA